MVYPATKFSCDSQGSLKDAIIIRQRYLPQEAHSSPEFIPFPLGWT